MSDMVVGFGFANEQVLLIEKRRPPWQAGKLNGVGGHIEKGESPECAMSREFEEETGMHVMPYDWRLFCRMLHSPGGNLWFYYADLSSFPVHRVLRETDERLWWVCVSSIPENALNNLHWLIPMAQCEKTFATVLDWDSVSAKEQ